MTSLGATGATPERLEAARELADAVLAELVTERGVHAETAVSGAARMAGAYLLASFGLPLEQFEPGQPLFTDRSNEEGPRLLHLLLDTLAAIGVDIDGAALSAAVPAEHAPHMDFLETQRRLGPAFARVIGRRGLSPVEAAEAAALAAALLIGQTAAVLTPSIGAAVAAEGLVEGSKTVPAREEAG